MSGLVLSRKVDQRILIGNDITVRVNRIDRNVVRLQIEAPRNVVVLRAELAKRDDKQEPVA